MVQFQKILAWDRRLDQGRLGDYPDWWQKAANGPRITSVWATTRPQSLDPLRTDERRNPGWHIYG